MRSVLENLGRKDESHGGLSVLRQEREGAGLEHEGVTFPTGTVGQAGHTKGETTSFVRRASSHPMMTAGTATDRLVVTVEHNPTARGQVRLILEVIPSIRPPEGGPVASPGSGGINVHHVGASPPTGVVRLAPTAAHASPTSVISSIVTELCLDIGAAPAGLALGALAFPFALALACPSERCSKVQASPLVQLPARSA